MAVVCKEYYRSSILRWLALPKSFPSACRASLPRLCRPVPPGLGGHLRPVPEVELKRARPAQLKPGTLIWNEMRVYLVTYDPTWTAKFHAESMRLAELLEPWRAGPIEHVGSTAVPGLCAKPVIDVMVGVNSLVESAPAIDTLTLAGYQYAAYKTDVMHWFCKPSFEFRTHHVHLIPFEGVLWQQRLAFRDALRADRELAIEYANLKQNLARAFEFDREAYTEGKTAFIERVLTRPAAG